MNSGLSRRPSGFAVSAMLLMVIMMPTLPFYFGFSSSLALGTCIAAIVLLAVFVEETFSANNVAQGYAGGTLLFSPGTLTTLVVAGVFLHGAFGSLVRPFDYSRAGFSIIPLLLTVAAAGALGLALSRARNMDVHRAIKLCFWTLSVVALLGIVGIGPPSSAASPKPMFPFTEPSHFALVFIPMLMYCCVASAGPRRFIVLFLGVAIAMFIENLTLVVGCFLVAFVCLRRTTFVVLVLIFGVAAAQLDLSYFLARVNLGDDTQNLSSLVYLQGWQLVADAWSSSGGWGLGFQQMGLQGNSTEAGDAIYALIGDSANVLDGSFVFAKLASEFGFLGVVMIGLYLVFAWRAVRELRRASFVANKIDCGIVFAQSVVASYFVELFVRGTGYFAGTSILLIASFWLLALRCRGSIVSGSALHHTRFGYSHKHSVGTLVEAGATPRVV